MKTKLPEPLYGYFDAVNREDLAAMLAPFAANAVVKDEGKTRIGHVAVREWIAEVTEKYHPRFEVEDAVEQGPRATVVTGLVSGAFQGSPVRLRYAFTLSAGKITHLEIS
jgi:ketosteroid isomerase-like protein